MIHNSEVFEKPRRFSSTPELSSLPLLEKRKHLRDSILDAVTQDSKEHQRGQPPMAWRFKRVTEIVEELESIGIPFGTCPTSRMNRRVTQILNDEAGQSCDPRRSHTKQIRSGAVEKWLRKVSVLRALTEHFVNMPPYHD